MANKVSSHVANDGTAVPIVYVDIGGGLYAPAVATAPMVPATGELAGSAAALQMPSVPCALARFKAAYDNVGRVYVGTAGVTKAAGTTTTTAGFQLSAGEDTGWLPVANLNAFYRICDNAGDDLTYVVLG